MNDFLNESQQETLNATKASCLQTNNQELPLNSNTPKKNRNANFELLRIIAIFMVVFNHNLNRHYFGGQQGFLTPLLLNMINVCAVGCFFMITGYYLFNNRPFKKRLKKLFLDVLIPSFVIIILIMLGKSFISEIPFWEALKNEIWTEFKEFLAFGLTRDYGYLWFILSYSLIFLWYPLLKYICVNTKKENMIRRTYIILCLTMVIFDDISHLSLNSINIKIPMIFGAVPVLFVLLGYEMKVLVENGAIEKYKNQFRYFGLFAYAFGVVCQMLLTYYLVNKTNEADIYFTFLNNLFSVTSAVGLFFFFLTLSFKNKTACKIITTISATSFHLYLVQNPIIEICYLLFINKFIEAFSVWGIILGGICSFFVSLIVGFIFYYLQKFVYKLLKIK